MLYNPPSGATNPNASYIGKNVAGGIQGSRVPKNAVEHPQREIVNFITKSGKTPSASNLNQLAEAVQSGQVDYVSVTGTNALSGALDPVPVGTLPNGMRVLIWCPNSNTGAVTLALNGGAANQVLRRSGGNLVAGDIPSGGFFLLLAHRTGNWHCLSPVASEDADTISEYSPQRLAFDQYFTDDNPSVQANTAYDTDGDAGTRPVLAVEAYEYDYTSAFPDEKTLINVLLVNNLYVQRPGTANVKAYTRLRATNAAGVNRNNYVTIDAKNEVVTQDWKSLSISMLVGKNAGASTLAFQQYVWWAEQTANVGGDPYRVFLDDCEMVIIERVVDALPLFPYSD